MADEVNQVNPTTGVQLIIAGRVVAPDEIVGHHTLRFYKTAAGDAEPVLYTDGKRETREWQLKVEHREPRDPNGRSG